MRNTVIPGDKHAIAQGDQTYHVVSCTDGLGIAEIGSVCMLVWRDAVVSSRFERQREALESVVSRYPGRAGLVCVIEPSTPPPDEHYRKASTQMIAKYGDRLRCVACVIEGGGFRAAITRSVLSVMETWLSSYTFEVKFAATVAAAAPWIAKLCDDVSPLSLLQAHEQLRLGLHGAQK